MGNEASTVNNAGDNITNIQSVLVSAGKTLSGACGSLGDTFEEPSDKRQRSGFVDIDDDVSLQTNPMSQMFARALISEAMGKMTPAEMAEREKVLLKAQQRARHAPKDGPKPIGIPGPVQGGVMGAIKSNFSSVGHENDIAPSGKLRVTIGIFLSRRNATVGHPETVTRQTAFDFNELQDRHYQYVSSTDESGWRAGGGERGGTGMPPFPALAKTFSEDGDSSIYPDDFQNNVPFQVSGASPHAQKKAAADTVHIPIIHIDCDSQSDIESIISSLARGEIFIPHMAILPMSLGVTGTSPPDLVTNFLCERNDDVPPDEWPNWCLEFMHNQLYEYFAPKGAKWMKRPFQITLAKKVRWKTAKHMNKFFAKSEAVLNEWRDKGPQYLDPQESHFDPGASLEEVSRPHGIYLIRRGVPTNYFPPNFAPPYCTKLTRSLLLNVIDKSWDKKRRDWSYEAIPLNISPSSFIAAVFGCNDASGYLASEATSEPLFAESQKRIGLSDSNTNITHRNIVKDNNVMQQLQQELYSRNRGIGTDNIFALNIAGDVSNSRSSIPRESEPHSSKLGSNKKPSSFTRKLDDEKDNVESSTVTITDKNSKHSSVFQPFEDDAETSSKYDSLFGDVGALHIPDNDEVEHPAHKISSPVRLDPPEDGMFNTSVGHNEGKGGESQTTVPINNASSAKFIQLERERKKQRDIERENERKKVEELELALQQKMKSSNPRDEQKSVKKGFPFSVGSPGVKKSNRKAKGGDSEDEEILVKDQIEFERGNWEVNTDEDDSQFDFPEHTPPNLQRINQPQKSTSLMKSSVISPARSKLHIAIRDSSPKSLSRGFSSTKSVPPLSPVIMSQGSTDYSFDDNENRSINTTGDGSLIGAQFAGDGSVFTATSDYRNLVAASDDASLSVLESHGNPDEVPTDEELYAVGWAKAFDTNSGAYYYFTLDHKTIVWDNPLGG